MVSENKITPEAERALAEAPDRRKKKTKSDLPKELGGPNRLEPTRFGDWEKKGLAVDF